MLKLYFKSFLFITVTVLSIKLIDSYCIQDELFHSTYNRVFNKKEKFDFVYMGNSHSQRSYNATYVDSVFGTKSINIGGSAHHFRITNAIFQELINNEELRPKTLLIVEVSPWQFKDYETERLKFLQMAALDEIKYSKNYFQIINKFYQLREYPKVLSSTIRFHNDLMDNIIETQSKLRSFKKSNVNGFQLTNKRQLNQQQKEAKADYKEMAMQYSNGVDSALAVKIEEESEEIILEMINQCKEKEINLLFVTSPAINKIYNKTEFGKIKYIENLMTSKSVHYLNFNRFFNELNLNLNDFSDYSHLNKYGNKKIAPMLLSHIEAYVKLNKSKNITVDIKTKVDEDINVNKKPLIVKMEVSNWKKVKMYINPTTNKFNKKEIFNVSRNSSTESAYVSVYKGSVSEGKRYKASIIVKKGSGNNFGLRITGVYPNRVDAVFNLDKGELKGAAKYGNFEKEIASIKDLGGGWYKCELSGIINADNIKIILGPTDENREMSSWEGVINSNNDVYIVPSSLEISEISN